MNLTLGINEKLDILLRDLAAKLGVTVKDLWTAGITYTYASGVTDIVSAILILIAILFLMYLTYRFATSKEDLSTLCIFTGLPLLFLFPSFVFTLRSGIKSIIAPEGVLLMDIISKLTSK